MSAMLESLLTPEQRDQADRIDAAMVQLSGLLAERAVLETATRALDVSRRAAFEAIRSNTGPWRAVTAKPAMTVSDMQDQITEAKASLAAAETALCAWYGQPDMERARTLMDDAVAFLAEG